MMISNNARRVAHFGARGARAVVARDDDGPRGGAASVFLPTTTHTARRYISYYMRAYFLLLARDDDMSLLRALLFSTHTRTPRVAARRRSR